MFPTDIKTWVLYIILTVLLGAIGSGFWETAFKPFFSALGRTFLKVLTLGMKSAQNALYKDIAKRSDNKPILFIVFLIGFAFSIALGAASYDFYKKVIVEKETIAYKEKLSKLPKQELQSEITKLEQQLRDGEKELAFIFLFLSLIGSIISANIHVRSKYVSTAVQYFDQCLAICLPYIDDITEKRLRSEFAQIKTKTDFTALLNKLNKVANDNSITLPLFVLI